VSHPFLHVVDAALATTTERVGLVTFVEVWSDVLVVHALLDDRLVGPDLHRPLPRPPEELAVPRPLWWAVEDDVGTTYACRRWGFKFRDEWWSHELVAGPAPPRDAGRLTVIQPLLGARADIDLQMWPERT
jgi:hypothetical protein